MTLREFADELKVFISRIPDNPILRARLVRLHIVQQEDGDWHLESVVKPGEPNYDAGLCMWSTIDWVNGLDEEWQKQSLIGATSTAAPITPALASAAARPAADLALDPLAVAAALPLVKRLSKWYWNRKWVHVPRPDPGPLPLPPGSVPIQPLPPADGNPLDSLPPLLDDLSPLPTDPLSELSDRLRALVDFPDILAGVERLLEILREAAGTISDDVRLFVVAFGNVSAWLARVGASALYDAVASLGLTSVVDSVATAANLITSLLGSALGLAGDAFSFGMTGLRVINFCLQDFTEYR
jgi:hypothetical protein